MSAPINPALLAPADAAAARPPVGAAAAQRPAGAAAQDRDAGGRRFADVLADATTGAGTLHFSKHALERVQRRGIPLDAATLGRLHSGVGRIAAKGARDSLVLVDGTAFVVSVGNRTVITAVGPEHMRDQVFTNIDSAVIA